MSVTAWVHQQSHAQGYNNEAQKNETLRQQLHSSATYWLYFMT